MLLTEKPQALLVHLRINKHVLTPPHPPPRKGIVHTPVHCLQGQICSGSANWMLAGRPWNAFSSTLLGLFCCLNFIKLLLRQRNLRSENWLALLSCVQVELRQKNYAHFLSEMQNGRYKARIPLPSSPFCFAPSSSVLAMFGILQSTEMSTKYIHDLYTQI